MLALLDHIEKLTGRLDHAEFRATEAEWQLAAESTHQDDGPCASVTLANVDIAKIYDENEILRRDLHTPRLSASTPRYCSAPASGAERAAARGGRTRTGSCRLDRVPSGARCDAWRTARWSARGAADCGRADAPRAGGGRVMTRAAMMATTRYGRAMSQYPRSVAPSAHAAQHKPQPHAWAPRRATRRRRFATVASTQSRMGVGCGCGSGCDRPGGGHHPGNPEVARATADLRASWSGLVDASGRHSRGHPDWPAPSRNPLCSHMREQ
ncbi:hypothetical protein EDD28_2473 [Salana multivorans]|uniref:Uncharacterized protein n=1 Tax=Salana multivorans TaxID=120377 RepID=A0A3N2CZY3_9MICO|nr:hypothetical protein EDD28_2473 [Salana multivorans]